MSAPLSLCTYLIHAGACSKKNLQHSTATGQQTPSGMLKLKKKCMLPESSGRRNSSCFLSRSMGKTALALHHLFSDCLLLTMTG